MTVKLSKRLTAIAERVPAGSRLADIGSDHALLPVYLAQQGIVAFAVAGEVNAGPFEAAAKQVREAGLSGRIAVRKGDGLEVLHPGEADTVTIAGMGGSLIVSILSAEPDKLAGVARLVLQPNVGEEQVRRWLDENGWALTDEHILEEDGKIYEILTAVRAEPLPRGYRGLYADGRTLACGLRIDADMLFAMGPYLLNKPAEAFFAKWKLEAAKLERICESLRQSELPASREREADIRSRIDRIEEVLQCLRTDSK